MPAEFIVIIPARYGSTRLPGKPLQKIGSESLIENVFNAAAKSNATDIYIATDDDRIVNEVERFGGNVILTSQELLSGTDRLHDAALKLNLPPSRIIVNLQGDEYNFCPNYINYVADMLHTNTKASITTLCKSISTLEELNDQNIVKVITDNSGRALYFSRSAIPWSNPEKESIDESNTLLGYKHIGIYAYRVNFLKIYADLNVPEIEAKESLEQLRALYNGYKIYVQQVDEMDGIEVNTQEDLEKARKLAAYQV